MAQKNESIRMGRRPQLPLGNKSEGVDKKLSSKRGVRHGLQAECNAVGHPPSGIKPYSEPRNPRQHHPTGVYVGRASFSLTQACAG
jgi:hypothetical protein